MVWIFEKLMTDSHKGFVFTSGNRGDNKVTDALKLAASQRNKCFLFAQIIFSVNCRTWEPGGGAHS